MLHQDSLRQAQTDSMLRSLQHGVISTYAKKKVPLTKTCIFLLLSCIFQKYLFTFFLYVITGIYLVLQKDTSKSEILKENESFNLGFKTFLAAFLATVLSIRYLDGEIALRVMHFIQSVHPINKVTENIPDLLPHFVVVATISMWAVFFYRLLRKKLDIKTRFLMLSATVLPFAYLAKTVLKFVFGRTSPRHWLKHHDQLSFHWFTHWSSSFPSGHMIVFAALGAAIWIYYPQYRGWVLTFLILLGAALIGTDYHFLSDVIAGAYLGVLTTYSIKYLFEKIKINFR